MGTIRAYDENIKDWVVISTSDASSTSVRSEKLLPEGNNTSNVEEVLMNMKDDINLLKSNVSWLAKHGGGGSGGGTGGGSINAEIFINDHPTGTSIVLTDSLEIKVQSNLLSAVWDITAVGVNKVIKNVTNVNKATVTKEDIKKANIVETFQLTVTATNNETLTQVYWNGTIYVANASLIASDINTPYDGHENMLLTYNYNIGVVGVYTLVINEEEIINVNLLNNSGSFNISLNDIPDLTVGSNVIRSLLISESDSNIYSNVIESYIILTAEKPVIHCNFSSDESNPTEYVLSPTSTTTIPIKYAVYYDSIKGFKTLIHEAGRELQLLDFQTVTTYNDYNVSHDGSYVVKSSEEKLISFAISIFDGSSIYTKNFFIQTKAPDYKFLDNGKSSSIVFDFNSYDGIIDNGVWKDFDDNFITINNINLYSSIIKDDKIMRFLNASYGVLSLKDNKSISERLISTNVLEFTLSFCYKADFHPDDDRVILLWGDLFGETGEYSPKTGIVIRDHKLYVALNTLDLLDRELSSITITYKDAIDNSGNTTKQGMALVYIDGVVEAAFNVKRTEIIPPIEVANMYLAALIYDGKSMFYTDVNIYRILLYDICLSPYDILFDYLNTQAYVNHDGYKPDITCITEGLQRNFIKETDKGLESFLWNNVSSQFDNNKDSFFDYFDLSHLVNIGVGDPTFVQNISEYKIPIPIMLIDVSKSSAWTWENFITPGTTLGKCDNCYFTYYDLTLNNSSPISGTLWVDIQGTSTRGDFVKNLNIGFDNSIFVPKPTWFPEKVYTLKADIVDSSHSLNASIGRFVNEEFGFKYTDDGKTIDKTKTPWFPFPKVVEKSFREEKGKTNSTINKYFPKATLKHGVEGFPVFLIINFNNPEGGGEIKSLGFYQFILGRDSARNLGFEIITMLDGMEEDSIPAYPYYKNGVRVVSDIINKGYWVEFGLNDSFSVNQGFQEMTEGDFKNALFTGAFWQSDDGDGVYYNSVAEVKYHSFGSEAVKDLTLLKPFVDFVNTVKLLPVTNRRYSSESSNFLDRNTFSGITYPKYKYVNNGSRFLWEKIENESNSIVLGGDDLKPLLSNINLQSIGKYFVIAMFFGLIDNFQKNMPMKFFLSEDGVTFEPPILGIYDTDTGCGGTNEGIIKVSEDVWLSPLTNTGLLLTETSKATDENYVYLIIGNSNKLWYLDSGDLNYSLYDDSDKSGSIFSGYWNDFLKHLGVTNLELLVDNFMNKYFIAQTYGCGELLFNLTYFCKYLNKYKMSGLDTASNLYGKLHGRRIKQIRNWLRNRVHFLDSMFCAMGMPPSMLEKGDGLIIQPLSINISSGSTPEFELSTNKPTILKVSHQGSNATYVYGKKNKTTKVYWGSNSVVDTSYQHIITYANSIQNLGSSNYKLSDIYYQGILSGSIPYLTEYNVSNCSKLTSMVDTTWNIFKYNDISELRTINCENTAKSGSSINFVVDVSKGFLKLLHINLLNSCVSLLVLPEKDSNIPLLSLDIAGALLTSLDLSYQSLIDKLDISNCNKLGSLTILNCSKLTTLNLNLSLTALSSVSISSESFTTFVCENNTAIKKVNIQSSNLKSVSITKCTKLESITITGTSLESLDLSGCSNLTEVIIETGTKNTIKLLNLSGTKVALIKYSQEEPDGDPETVIMDLSRFEAIDNFNIKNNTAVKYIKFTNNKEKPIIIKNSFTGCTSLLRVYGHLDINCHEVFKGCIKFSIHGSDIENVTYSNNQKDIKVMQESGRVLHPMDIPSIISNNEIIFLETRDGKLYTNLKFTTNNAYYSFSQTNCTLFDIYYVLYNIGNLTNLDHTFYALQKARFIWENENLDNSPNVNTFIKGKNIISLYGCFRGITLTCKIISPEHDNTGKVIKNNGLFSPLVSCTNLNIIFGNAILYTDKYVFRRVDDDDEYKFKSIGYFYPNILTNDIRTAPYDIVNDSTNYIKYHKEVAGDFGDFFKNIPNVTDIHAFGDNTYFINYDITHKHGGLNIPSGVTSLKAVLRASYATGDLIPELLFAEPAQVRVILHSFLVNRELPSGLVDAGFTKATFKITLSIFKEFTELQQLTYSSGGDNPGDLFTCPFNGAGLDKTIDQSDFPYKILEPCKNKITHFRGFFLNVTSDKISEVTLPGELFINTPNIQYVGALFRNFGINYLLESEGFAKCPNLTEVAHMFSSEDITESKLSGSIPSKLFYHGMLPDPKSIGGEYITIDYNPYDVEGYKDEQETIPIYRVEREIDEGIIKIEKYDKEDVLIPRNNINNILGCFINNNCSAYTKLISEIKIEINPNYHPGTHRKDENTGKWVPVVTDPNKYTFIWEYDGVNTPENYEGENLDCAHSSTHPEVKAFDGDNDTGTLNFMCAPDLLRYCTSNANVTLLFKNSGHNSNGNIAHTNHPSDTSYGIKGRIPPYLLKPVKSITSILEMFVNCKQLSYYTTEGGKAYIIPESFFKYTPLLTNLESAFLGLIFPAGISLDVFKLGVNNALGLKVARIFMYPLFLGTYGKPVEIGPIFGTPLNIVTLTRAFSINTDENNSSGNDMSNRRRDQYVTFNKVFEKYAKKADTYVFDGYNASTTKFINHTLRNDIDSANYRYKDNTLG